MRRVPRLLCCVWKGGASIAFLVLDNNRKCCCKIEFSEPNKWDIRRLCTYAHWLHGANYSTPVRRAVLPRPLRCRRLPAARFLRNRLKQANDAAVKKLSSVRALYRLTLASGGGDMAGAAGSRGGGRGDAEDGGEGGAPAAVAADPHPHITALATVLGEGSKLMVRLAESSLGDGVMEPVAELLHNDSKAQVWIFCRGMCMHQSVCCKGVRSIG